MPDINIYMMPVEDTEHYVIYCIAGKFGKFGESSVTRQTKPIQNLIIIISYRLAESIHRTYIRQIFTHGCHILCGFLSRDTLVNTTSVCVFAINLLVNNHKYPKLSMVYLSYYHGSDIPIYTHVNKVT